MNDFLPFFFGPRADYYTGVVEDIEEGKIRFNEGAFFFGMFWMAYRKMYVNAAITFAVIMAESGLEDWLIPELSETFAYTLASNILIASVIGFTGNRIYVKFARRRVADIVQNVGGLTNPEVIAQLREEGGVSWLGPLVLLASFIVLVTVMFYLTM